MNFPHTEALDGAESKHYVFVRDRFDATIDRLSKSLRSVRKIEDIDPSNVFAIFAYLSKKPNRKAVESSKTYAGLKKFLQEHPETKLETYVSAYATYLKTTLDAEVLSLLQAKVDGIRRSIVDKDPNVSMQDLHSAQKEVQTVKEFAFGEIGAHIERISEFLRDGVPEKIWRVLQMRIL